jgi:periplasmic divalent cation tolerance protein
LVEPLIARVRALHSYTVPCVVALPIVAGDPAFLDWIGAETRAPGADPQ